MMIATELVDKIQITSIVLISIFILVGLPCIICDNVKASNYCLGGAVLSLISSLVITIVKVWS